MWSLWDKICSISAHDVFKGKPTVLSFEINIKKKKKKKAINLIAPITIAAENKFYFYFFRQMIHMKYEDLFSLKNK